MFLSERFLYPHPVSVAGMWNNEKSGEWDGEAEITCFMLMRDIDLRALVSIC